VHCYGSSAVIAPLSEQCVRRTAGQRGRGLLPLRISDNLIGDNQSNLSRIGQVSILVAR
jgi:hypothetical protein